MRIDIMTLFTDMCDSVLGESIIGRARATGKVEINTVDIRNYSVDRHRQVDDKPYGGGMGMVMLAQPIFDCYNDLCSKIGAKPHLIYMTPQGKTLTQDRVKELAKLDNIAILCGHYEGIDERVIEELQPEEISVGDYVLTGGELAAMVLIDSVSRYVDGVLSDESTDEESFSNGLLEYPQYTRPEIFDNVKVPDVLISGHHENIRKWRRERSLENTFKKRPEMLENIELTDKEKVYIEKLKKEVQE